MISEKVAIEACAIANEFIGDLVAGTRLYRYIDRCLGRQGLTEMTLRPMRRMCLFHLILTLEKWQELQSKPRYRHVLTKEADVYSHHVELQCIKTAITDARNKYVAHAGGKKKNTKSLTSKEKDVLLQRVTRNDVNQWLDWINNREGNEYPSTVVSIVQHVRNRIMEKYNLSDQSIVDG